MAGITETPWGSWEVLVEADGYKVKRIIVSPGKRLSYQRHFKRGEHWYGVMGEGVVIIDDQRTPVVPGQAIDIPCLAAHRAVNEGDAPFVFIEVQRGEYLGEDDIERLEDDYGRAR